MSIVAIRYSLFAFRNSLFAISLFRYNNETPPGFKGFFFFFFAISPFRDFAI